MKNKKIIIALTIFFILALITGIIFYCYQNDNIRFKLSYEYVNYIEYTNGKKIKVSIPVDNKIKYLTEDEIIDFLENGTGILYFGYNTCPWCRNSVPILIDTVRKNNIDTIYYADVHKLNLSSIEKLYEILDSYLEENSEGKKVIAVPDVYFIKEGTIIGHHLGTVDSFHNPYNGMSDSEKQELESIYQELIEEMESWEN
jgi:predicted bacteriocin transport accessory protein